MPHEEIVDFEVQLPLVREPALSEDGVIMDMASAQIAAAKAYDPSNRAHTTVLNGEATTRELNQDWIDTYSVAPQADKEKTLAIINVIRGLVNRNDILGAVVEAVENNINTKWRLHWRTAKNRDVESKEKTKEIKKVIEEFLQKIDLPILIRKSVTTAYMDGNYIMHLKNGGKPMEDDILPEYTVDVYPIGVAQISQYTSGYNDPIVLIDMNELRSKIRKNYAKNKKNRAIFYEDEEKEVKATFPKEIVKAYKDKERYAKLDVAYTGVMRVNNQNLPYGLTPLFRSLESILMLDALGKADRMNAKARTKKVLAQYLNKEILGPTWDKDTYKAQAYAHNTLLAAWSNPVVLVTCPATVREIKYVEPNAEMTSIDTINYYRNRVMATLGVSFLNINGTSSMTASNISVKQLLKEVNKISQQLESILFKWFKIILRDAGYDPELAPKITIIDSEAMEADLRMELARFMLNTMNSSYESAYEVMGIPFEDELERRDTENEEGIDQIMYPRATAFTTSDDDTETDGRPKDENPDDEDKQALDHENNKIKD